MIEEVRLAPGSRIIRWDEDDKNGEKNGEGWWDGGCKSYHAVVYNIKNMKDITITKMKC